jgi:hypothetical protein
MATPITQLLMGMKNGRKTGLFKWPVTAEKAFQSLCGTFAKAPMLEHFNPELCIQVETDASQFAVAGILSQLKPSTGHWHPIAFWLRKMAPAEQNYKTYDQELLAIVNSFKHWHHYLKGSAHAIEVLTDHNNLKGFMKVKELKGRQVQWVMYLAGFDFNIFYQTGITNPVNAPSRHPDYKADKLDATINDFLPTLKHKLTQHPQLMDTNAAVHALFTQNKVCVNAIQSIGSMPGNRNPWAESEPSVSKGIELPVDYCCNIGACHLNPVAGAAGCKQFIPHAMIRELTMCKTADIGKAMVTLELIQTLQQNDDFAKQKVAALS